MLPLRGIALPDYRRAAVLHLRQPSEGLYRAVLEGNLWRMRNELGEFRGANVSNATKTEVERGTPGATM